MLLLRCSKWYKLHCYVVASVFLAVVRVLQYVMLLKWGHQTEAALPISSSFITLSSDCGVNISKWKCDEGKVIILDWVTLLSDVCAIWCHMYVCAGTHVRLWGHLPIHIKRQMSACTRESGNERTHDLIHTQVCPVCNPNLLRTTSLHTLTVHKWIVYPKKKATLNTSQASTVLPRDLEMMKTVEACKSQLKSILAF